MNKKLAQEVAEKVIEYLFSDGTGKPISRLMLVYVGEDFKNPGWGREAIRDEIVKQILKAAQPVRALDGAVYTCKIMSSVIGENHAEDCALHYPPRQ